MHNNKIIVAPMVRVCTLPFRLLAIDYGADLVYTEETIDFKMLRSVKKKNEVLGTIDFADKADGTVFFRTCKKEQTKLIFQIGTCDAQRALKVGQMIEPYVAGLDVNMGCPKEFSLKGGMGAALLTQPEKVKAILTTLVQGLNIPVTCKIRLLKTIDSTIDLCKMIEKCGVAAITIHGRTKEERPNNRNHNDIIKMVADSLTIPVISNGGSKEISCYGDIEKFRKETGGASVMLARSAMWNCSILRPEGFLPLDEVIETYLRYCVDYDNPFTYSKYTVQNMLRELQVTPRGRAFLETQTLQEICSLWGLREYFETHVKKQEELQKLLNVEKESGKMFMPPSADHVSIVEKSQEGQKSFEMPVQFIRGNFNNADLPKMLLNTYVFRNQVKGPDFNCVVNEKFFRATVEVDGIRYSSSLREKSRRYSEQAAAMVCLHVLHVVDKTYGFAPTVGARKYQYVIDEMKNDGKQGAKRESTSEDDATSISNCEIDYKKKKVGSMEQNDSGAQQNESVAENPGIERLENGNIISC